MTLQFIRQLIIYTISNVTGASPKEVTSLISIKLSTRDWEQVFSRLEATLDIQTGMLTTAERAFDIETLAHALHAKVTDNVIT